MKNKSVKSVSIRDSDSRVEGPKGYDKLAAFPPQASYSLTVLLSYTPWD